MTTYVTKGDESSTSICRNKSFTIIKSKEFGWICTYNYIQNSSIIVTSGHILMQHAAFYVLHDTNKITVHVCINSMCLYYNSTTCTLQLVKFILVNELVCMALSLSTIP